MRVNLSIDYNLVIKISQFDKIIQFQMSKESLLELNNILLKIKEIPENIPENEKEYLHNQKIRDLFQSKWRKNKMSKMTDMEMKAYQQIFVYSTMDFNLYISKICSTDRNLFIFNFLGNSSQSFNIFDYEFDNDRTIETLSKFIINTSNNALELNNEFQQAKD